MKNPKVTDTREFWKGGNCRDSNKAAGGLNQRDLGHFLALMLSVALASYSTPLIAKLQFPHLRSGDNTVPPSGGCEEHYCSRLTLSQPSHTSVYTQYFTHVMSLSPHNNSMGQPLPLPPPYSQGRAGHKLYNLPTFVKLARGTEGFKHR